MITRLFIRNLVLIDQATIPFGAGLNILSGETGAGKSAILSALGLIAGKRSDLGLVRTGAEKAIVEAVFDIDKLAHVKKALSDGGIAFEEGDELIITRELLSNGKSRIFINNQSVPNHFLKMIGEQLIGIVSQHASHSLFSLEYHRQALDLYGGLQEKVQLFAEEWKREKELAAELEELSSGGNARLLSFERYNIEMEEIASVKVREGEEEELFLEYTRLVNAEEIASYCHEIDEAFNGEGGALNQLKTVKRNFEKLVLLDPSYRDSSESLLSAIAELQEIAFALDRQNEYDPERVAQINERLTLLAQMKRKYGDMCAYQQELKIKMEALERADLRLEELKELRPKQKEKTDAHAKELTHLRSKALVALQKQMTLQIRQLNMPKATFSIALTPQKRTHFGDDAIEWFLAPNVGEQPVSVRECASGGELSRVMLALQALLGDKEQIPTLLFDEIDGNIGGETAAVVGDKLRDIAKDTQVLCITHFPQVARRADRHFRIQKQEVCGRTLTLVDELGPSDRELELQRMLGMKNISVDVI